MSFFSKIKDNFNNGGIDVKLQSAATASMQDPSIPVSVSITSKSDKPHTVKSVYVQLMRESRNQAFNDDTTNTAPTRTEEVVARADDATNFVINPGESKVVSLNIIMNAGAAIAAQLPEGSGVAQIANAFEKLQTISNTMNNDSYEYYISAVADVEGIAFDPSDRNDLMLLKPGEIGAAANFKI